MKLHPMKCKEMQITFMSNQNFILNPILIGTKSIESQDI